MNIEPQQTRRMFALFCMGWVVLNYPILSLFNLPAMVGGIPLLYFYLFVAWIVWVLLMIIALRTRTSSSSSRSPSPNP